MNRNDPRPPAVATIRRLRIAAGLFAGVDALGADAVASVQEAATTAPSAAPEKAAELTGAGIAMMTVSLAFVWILTLWCFKRVLSTPAVTDPGPAGKP